MLLSLPIMGYCNDNKYDIAQWHRLHLHTAYHAEKNPYFQTKLKSSVLLLRMHFLHDGTQPGKTSICTTEYQN